MPGPDGGPDLGPDSGEIFTSIANGVTGADVSALIEMTEIIDNVRRFKQSAFSALGIGGSSAAAGLDVDLLTTTLNKPQFYSAGREILSVEIKAAGAGVPSALLFTPIILLIGPTPSRVAPAPSALNSRTAAMRTEDGLVYAEIFVGSSIGSNRLPHLVIEGSPTGVQYQLWMLLDGGPDAEELYRSVGTFTMY